MKCANCTADLSPSDTLCGECGYSVSVHDGLGTSPIASRASTPGVTPSAGVEDVPESRGGSGLPVPQGRDDASAPPPGYQKPDAIPLLPVLPAALFGGLV